MRQPDGRGGWLWNLDGVEPVLYRLPELLAADATEIVFIPEGEKDVDRLWALDSVATCNPMGAGKWRDCYSTFLRERHVVFLPHNDQVGRDHSRASAQSVALLAASVKILELPDLPPGGDVFDFLNQGKTKEDLLALAEAAPVWTPPAEPDGDGFVSFVSSPPEPRPISESLRRVPAMAPEMIPGPLRGWLADVARRMQCPLEYPVVGAIIALAALVGRKVAIRPKRKDDWTVVPNLWGAVVGRPGIMKSPALEEAMRPLKRLEAEAAEAHAAAIAEHTITIQIAKARAEAAKDEMKRAAKKPGTSDEELRTLAQAVTVTDEGTGQVRKRYICNDSSIEKLGEILRDNPNGVLLFRDELTGFLRTLDKPGRESDRAFHLEGWSGLGSFTYDRISRGTVHIPSVCESILGGIQPNPLVRYIRAATSGDSESDDGFFQRFQLVVFPDPTGTFEIVDQWPDATEKNRAYAIFRFLDNFAPAQIGATLNDEEGIPYLRFTDEAQRSSTSGGATWNGRSAPARRAPRWNPTWLNSARSCRAWRSCST